MRVLAALIDTLLALLLTALLASSVGWFFAERAVVTFQVYSPDTIWNGPVPLMLGAISTVSYGFAFALVLALACEGIWGVSVGKILVRRRTVTLLGQSVSKKQSWCRYALKTAPWSLFCLALLSGRWELAIVSAAFGVWAAVDLGIALILRRRLWHDRVAGTRVAARSWPVGSA